MIDLGTLGGTTSFARGIQTQVEDLGRKRDRHCRDTRLARTEREGWFDWGTLTGGTETLRPRGQDLGAIVGYALSEASYGVSRVCVDASGRTAWLDLGRLDGGTSVAAA